MRNTKTVYGITFERVNENNDVCVEMFGDARVVDENTQLSEFEHHIRVWLCNALYTCVWHGHLEPTCDDTVYIEYNDVICDAVISDNRGHKDTVTLFSIRDLAVWFEDTDEPEYKYIPVYVENIAGIDVKLPVEYDLPYVFTFMNHIYLYGRDGTYISKLTASELNTPDKYGFCALAYRGKGTVSTGYLLDTTNGWTVEECE